MKVRTFIFLNSVLSLMLLASAGPTLAAPLVVGNNITTCSGAEFTTIQSAVNAASPGATIRVCAGTYVEQVSISKPLRIEADSGAILMPAGMVQNATSVIDASPFATAVSVSDANGVSIHGLVVDGGNAGIAACSPILSGILYQNSSGTIDHVIVRNFEVTGQPGCQSGLGIFVQSSGGTISRVSIEDCTVHDFQKNGITANESGTEVSINDNVVTGIGPTTGAAQNGIQVGFSAGGSISGNTVTNLVWSSCTSVSSCGAVAAGILVTGSDGVAVTGNTAGISNVAIFVDGDQADIEGNQTFAASVFDGIRVEGGEATVQHNQVFNGGESGIFIGGDNNVVEHNTITEAPIGILTLSGSTGDIIQDNHVFGVPIATQDPSVAKLAKRVSPVR
jgi:Periplasmic copper-binding protein (NosD)